jgi:hypothetical protein
VQLRIGPNWISATLTLGSAGIAMHWPNAGTLLMLGAVFVLLAGIRIDGWSLNLDWVNRKRLSQVIAGLLIMAVAFGGAFFLRPYLIRPAFAADIRSAIIYTAKSPLADFMIEYGSSRGETLSPVCYLFNIRITNTQDISESVSSYSILEASNESGPWTALQPISLIGNKLFHPGTHVTNPLGGFISFPHGTYRLGTPVQPNDLHEAVQILANPILDLQLQKSLLPHSFVQGWAAFDCANDTGSTDVGHNFYQIEIDGHTGVQAVVTLRTPLPKDGQIDPDIKALEVVGYSRDLSSDFVKYFHDK